ncbi:MAG: hypothetical protein EHM75_08550 [Desulfobacteraceae bacterium]|nr:MAG: hypothetical protein EHM75_08550 [Desulfobacteraceae bacterium]
MGFNERIKFYSSCNLEKITPPELHFRILTPLPIQNGNGETSIEDRVDYALPFNPLGEMAFPLVRRHLRRIFDHLDLAGFVFLIQITGFN